jgi:hypothetical protein
VIKKFRRTRTAAMGGWSPSRGFDLHGLMVGW